MNPCLSVQAGVSDNVQNSSLEQTIGSYSDTAEDHTLFGVLKEVTENIFLLISAIGHPANDSEASTGLYARLDEVFQSASDGKLLLQKSLANYGVSISKETPVTFNEINNNLKNLYDLGVSAGSNQSVNSVLSAFMTVGGRCTFVQGKEYPVTLRSTYDTALDEGIEQVYLGLGSPTVPSESVPKYGTVHKQYTGCDNISHDMDFCIEYSQVGGLPYTTLGGVQIADADTCIIDIASNTTTRIRRNVSVCVNYTAYYPVQVCGEIWDKTANVRVTTINAQIAPKYDDYVTKVYGPVCCDHRYHLTSARDMTIATYKYNRLIFNDYYGYYVEEWVPASYNITGYVNTTEKLDHQYVFKCTRSVNAVIGLLKG